MRGLMMGLVALVLLAGVPLSAGVVVNGPPVLLPGYSPNGTADEMPTYLNANGNYMLVYRPGDIASRTWDAGAGTWGPLTALPGLSGTGYNWGTLSPDGQSIFLNAYGEVITRSKLVDGVWTTPVAVSSGVYPYFNGQQLFSSHYDGAQYHLTVSNYNSVSDSFSSPPQLITDLMGSAGTGYGEEFAWVSRSGKDMIFTGVNPGTTTGDLYSAHWNGTNWTDVTALPFLHQEAINSVPCVAEDAGILDYQSTSGLTDSTRTLWQASVTVPEPSTLALLGVGAVGLLGYGWRRRKRRV